LLARTLMVQGTASSVGKSLLVTALCRLFHGDGVRVAPFKAQNMALNSFVTPDGGEIGRAQAVQAEAAGIEPAVEMNPILLKPEGDARSQVVVLGQAIGSMTAAEYHAYKPRLRTVIADSLARVRENYDLVVIEGAGSPVEINLKDRDLVNMHVARLADAPVLLVGDIDRGGVFASFLGTLELLDPDERARITAFVVNKFRGDLSLLEPGLKFLTERTGVPVLGVLPYLADLWIAEEDSVALDDRVRCHGTHPDQLALAVVRLPRISNYDDFQPLEQEPGLELRFVDRPEGLPTADLVILPGTKSTAADLAWLRQRGLATVIQERVRKGDPVLGICGGCQMLGESIEDPHRLESSEPVVPGLELLPLRTRFERRKVTARVQARALRPSMLTDDRIGDITGYEIHMGIVEQTDPMAAAIEIVKRNGLETRVLDGAVNERGTLVGTMIHGILANDPIRASLLRFLRRRRGLAHPLRSAESTKGAGYDRLAQAVRQHMDCQLLYRAAGLG
jgi:adenosylcobyric acid synthase